MTTARQNAKLLYPEIVRVYEPHIGNEAARQLADKIEKNFNDMCGDNHDHIQLIQKSYEELNQINQKLIFDTNNFPILCNSLTELLKKYAVPKEALKIAETVITRVQQDYQSGQYLDIDKTILDEAIKQLNVLPDCTRLRDPSSFQESFATLFQKFEQTIKEKYANAKLCELILRASLLKEDLYEIIAKPMLTSERNISSVTTSKTPRVVSEKKSESARDEYVARLVTIARGAQKATMSADKQKALENIINALQGPNLTQSIVKDAFKKMLFITLPHRKLNRFHVPLWPTTRSGNHIAAALKKHPDLISFLEIQINNPKKVLMYQDLRVHATRNEKVTSLFFRQYQPSSEATASVIDKTPGTACRVD